eukprot:6765192-Lingulodinium_polyedra.AAC.1
MQTLWATGGLNHPLLSHYWEHILKDSGLWADRHSDGIEQEVQRICLGAFEAKSERVALNRWMALLHSARSFNKTWHCRLVAYLQVEVMEGTAGFGQESLRSALGAVPASSTEVATQPSGGTASSSSGPKGTKTGAQALVRKARASCKNTLGLGARFLEDPDARRLSALIVATCKPMQAWHSKQNKANRSPQE